ncbi:50S ribosomal protein L21 [Patescibacteria group bacterium]|nr:50S ribosomal protein L21 [Patescibacteria group bacterium]MCG2701737.1 50S ribosomal protein L21 [Candidatus Parcubacteria bacterium]MBU4264642.1 50S ribosomal protein L21 [Patescibacteria group bacterium]MBU4390597.1 50S ribosomal protein L21 [Patescibacteria group bacterium]MBU4397506.1 50S ribosomal protein L21 [Patescibacteria group bacterium]
MKYAILAISGSQYLVEENKIYTIDKTKSKENDIITSDQVLLFVNDKDIKIGTPLVKNAEVEYKIAKHYKGKKLRVFQYKAKSRYRRRLGFRPQLTDIQILKITINTKTAKKQPKTVIPSKAKRSPHPTMAG